MKIRVVSVGWIGTALLALAGVWLLVAPAWVGYQPAGGHLLAATRNDLVVGAALLLMSVLGLFAQVAFAVHDMAQASPESDQA